MNPVTRAAESALVGDLNSAILDPNTGAWAHQKILRIMWINDWWI